MQAVGPSKRFILCISAGRLFHAAGSAIFEFVLTYGLVYLPV